MTAVSLYQLKLHCRIDTDDEDVTLSAYLSAATESVQQHLGITTPLDNTAPAPVKAAILLAAAGLYAQREDIGERQLHGNLTYHRLLAPYRVYA
jgi:uncharacterized phage protein (predicted DNA packaging)